MIPPPFLSRTAAALGRSLRRTLISWAARCAFVLIGIGLYALAHPRAGWLWWIGVAGTAISLVVALITHFFVPQRSMRAHPRVTDVSRRCARGSAPTKSPQ